MQAELEESVREQSGSCADLLARAARAEAATESLHLRATRLLQRIACNRQPLSAQEKGIKAELGERAFLCAQSVICIVSGIGRGSRLRC